MRLQSRPATQLVEVPDAGGVRRAPGGAPQPPLPPGGWGGSTYTRETLTIACPVNGGRSLELLIFQHLLIQIFSTKLFLLPNRRIDQWEQTLLVYNKADVRAFWQ